MPPVNIINSVSNHPYAAYLVIFLIALSESLAFVGLLVPGTMLMFGVGAVIAIGGISLKLALVVAIVGAIAGDGVSYWLGRHHQQRLKKLWPFRRYSQMLSGGEVFFRHHGGKSVLFGRFVGPVRPIIPIVAGMLGMSPLRFILVNILSAIGWAFAYILPGFFLGTSLALAGVVSIRLTVLGLLMVVLVWFFIWLCRKLVIFIENLGPNWFESLENWITSGTSPQGAMLPLRRFLSFLFLRQKGEDLLIAFLVLFLSITAWGLLAFLHDVVARDLLIHGDEVVFRFFQSLRSPWGDHIFVAIKEWGDALVNFSVMGAVLFLLLLKRCYRSTGYWLGALLVGAIFTQVFKWTLRLPGPVTLSYGISFSGFPGAHPAMSVVLYGFLAILIARGVRNSLRWGLFAAVFLVSFVIAFSGLYLGSLWLSNVLVGLFFGWGLIALAGIGYLRGQPEPVPKRSLGFVTLTALLVVGSWHVSHQQNKSLIANISHPPLQMMELKTWLEKGWRELPPWRVDLGEKRHQPLTLQWAGYPECLSRYLVSKGWQHPPGFSLKNALAMISPDPRVQNLPLFPRLHDGRFEKVLLWRAEGDKRWVLHLWPTNIQLKNRYKPLWIGTVETQVGRQLAGLITLPVDGGDYIQPLMGLAKSLEQEYELHKVYRKNIDFSGGNKLASVGWDGRVLLLTK